MPRIIIYKPCTVETTLLECLKFKAPIIEMFAPRDMSSDRLVGVRVINSNHIVLYTSPINGDRHNIRSELVGVLLDDSKCGPDYGFCETNINKTIHTIIQAMYPTCRVPQVLTTMLVNNNEQIVIVHEANSPERTPWFTTFETSEVIKCL